ncbi:MAG TPA: S8 family serine peptidase [Caldilineaceae bacterium]|nr:S8 family serine peptidase [Caldilineaceae bacterium]
MAEPNYQRRLADEGSATSAGTEPGAPGLATAEQNAPTSATAFSDPLYSQQWHLAAANIPAAWDYLTSQALPPGGNRNIVVAVIDTGVDYTHPDLAVNLWTNSREIAGNGIDDDGNGFADDIHGVTVVSNQPSGDPMDDHGHGTHVAGIIAAQAGNNRGGVGVAYNTQIMAIKAAQYSGVLSASDIAEAIYYAVQQGADVINMSFGGYARSQLEEDALAVAFGQAVLVAAAGNDGKINLPCPGGRDMYPAAYNWVLGVMASAPGGGRASFSNYDCTPHDSHEYELLAPGVDVWSSLPFEQYAAWDGTSMATPVVAGIAALARTRWADKNVYSSRFIMGQIAANASPVANALAALTVAPRPELTYLEHWLFDTTAQSAINDNDGIVDAGETIDLAVVIRNHWGKADNVSVKLEAWADGAVQADPYVTMITKTVSYGAVGSFNSDDNGLIYDAQGVITGVRSPFRFRVNPTTPNDHLIPFRLTMTAKNGYAPSDPTLTFVSRFYLIVQRGRELPRIISQDTVLTKDDYWIVSGPTLITTGSVVTITEGTQLQWGSSVSNNPYADPVLPYIQVEGVLRTKGSFAEPVELYPSPLAGGQTYVRNFGQASFQYARIRNPQFGQNASFGVNDIDHAFVNADGTVATPDLPFWGFATASLTNSILFKIQTITQDHNFSPGFADTNLFDASWIGQGYMDDIWHWSSWGVSSVKNSVFLQDNIHLIATRWLVTDHSFNNPSDASAYGPHRNNAFLSSYWNPNIRTWMRFGPKPFLGGNSYIGMAHNYWGTQSTAFIDSAIFDYDDTFNDAHIVYQPILTTPETTTYPFVWKVELATKSQSGMSALDGPTPLVGAEPVTFTVTFNRDMDLTVQPAVSFGPDVPVTDYTIHPINGGWQNPRTWKGTFNITPVTGDGYQLIRIAGPARAADDPWLVIGDDAGRFRFEIITSGTEAMNLQATGGEGYIDLAWTQDDFDLLGGYKLYRAESSGGSFTPVHSSIIPAQQKSFRDTNVQPGQPYFYKFTVIKTDMGESDFSNEATATPLDTIPPVITHTPVTTAPPGLALSLFADVTDNVAVQSVTLYYRKIGTSVYTSAGMLKTTGNRYSATVPANLLVSPGLEYYIAASDGVSTVTAGRATFPYQVGVVDRPTVTAVSPQRGPIGGGTAVTLSGSNFKAGASVRFGEAVCASVVVVSPNQITCTTPAHFPALVDVTVTNPDGQSGQLLRSFTFESDVASIGLPVSSGGQHDIVQIPLNVANAQGLAAASVTVHFNASVLKAKTATTGSLTPGWSIAPNTATSGQMRLSLASPGGTVSGSGVLANLEFEVLGSPGVTTTLRLSDLSLNSGAIPTQSSDGSFQVDLVYTVSGLVSFWNGGVVSDTLLTLTGNRLYAGNSGGDGNFTVRSAPAGNYTLTPSKSDRVNGISAYDASLALQHDAGSAILSGNAFTAADVDKSGVVNAMDAYYILQKAVDLLTLPFPGAGVVWAFNPASRAVTGLNANRTGQDFTAILLGDASGNWNAVGLLRTGEAQANAAHLRLTTGAVNVDGTVDAILWADPAGGTLYSLEMQLAYDTGALELLSVEQTAPDGGMALATNTGVAGQIRLALAGAQPITGPGELLVFHLRAKNSNAAAPLLTPLWAEANEGAVPVQWESSAQYRQFLPVVGN